MFPTTRHKRIYRPDAANRDDSLPRLHAWLLSAADLGRALQFLKQAAAAGHFAAEARRDLDEVPDLELLRSQPAYIKWRTSLDPRAVRLGTGGTATSGDR